jgi:hypothetical protein
VENDDCCSTLCHPVMNVCQCLVGGEPCTADVECCNGVCEQPAGMCN